MFKFNRTKNVNTLGKESQDDENIYTIMPPPGTIIGEATEEEMETAAELEIRHTVFMRLQDMKVSFDGTNYKELAKDIQNFETDSSRFWRKLAKRLSIPYEWPIRIDHANGPIYIGDPGVQLEEDDEN